MNIWRYAFVLVLILSSWSIQAKDTIYWRVIDWPPFYITHGQDQGRGIYDGLIDQMIAAMPEYHHKKVVMNTQRKLIELKKGSKVCTPSALANTPALLSTANSFLLPHRLIYHSYDYPTFKHLEKVSLDQLLSRADFKLGIASLRYPNAINAVLANHTENKNITVQNNYNSLIKMFFRKRFDGLIEYPPVINYSKKQLNLNIKTSSLQLQEISSQDYLTVHFACPNNEWGKTVIGKINQVLLEETFRANYLDQRLHWYDEQDQKILKYFYQRDYLKDKHRLTTSQTASP